MKTSLHSWMPVVSGSEPPLQEKPVRGSLSCPSQSWPGWRGQNNERWIYSRNLLKSSTPMIFQSGLHDLNIECTGFPSDLPIHVSEHEIQNETFPFSEGSSDRHHHHILISNIGRQQNSTERLCIQVKGVILLVDCHNLNWPRFTPHPLSYITGLLWETIKKFQLNASNIIRSHIHILVHDNLLWPLKLAVISAWKYRRERIKCISGRHY